MLSFFRKMEGYVERLFEKIDQLIHTRVNYNANPSPPLPPNTIAPPTATSNSSSESVSSTVPAASTGSAVVSVKRIKLGHQIIPMDDRSHLDLVNELVLFREVVAFLQAYFREFASVHKVSHQDFLSFTCSTVLRAQTEHNTQCVLLCLY
jgi:hypothetical protein